MPVNKKIVLHPLERLDLVDVYGLQDLVSKNIADAIAGISGQVHGLLRKWSSLSVNNTTDLITFNDFAFQGLLRQNDTQQEGWSSYIGIFDASSDTNGTCSFDEVKTLVQTYVTSVNRLPPTPNSESYVEETHGQYYPYIWARSVYGNSVQASRRFWSVGDNQENTQLVNTRVVEAVNFKVGTPDSVTGNQWAKIGRIVSWTNTGGVVSLSASGVKGYMIFDDMITAVTDGSGVLVDSGFAGLGGIAAGIEYLCNSLNTLVSSGQADDRTSNQYYPLYFNSQPYLSLGGLITEVMKLKAVKETISTANVFLTFDNRPLRGASRNFTFATKHLEATQPTQLFSVVVDYTAISELRATPYAPAGNSAITYESWDEIMALTSHFAIVFSDASLLNRNFVVTTTPITDRSGMVVIGNNPDPDAPPAEGASAYDGGGSFFDVLISDIRRSNNLLPSEEFNNAFKIKPITYKDSTGASVNGIGFKIRKNRFAENFPLSGVDKVGKIATAFTITVKILN